MNDRCHSCNNELRVDSRFCSNCGAPVVEGPASVAPDGIAMWSGGGVTTPPSAPEPVPVWEPEPPQFVAVEVTPPSRRGTGSLVGIGLAVVGVLAVGLLALRFLMGGSDSGGAASPEAVVQEMVAAINAQDPLAVVSLMAPDELDGVDTLVEDVTAYYRELGLDVVVDAADGAGEFDVTVELDADGVDVQMEGDEAAIVSFELSGRLEVDGAEPGSVLDEEDLTFSSRDLEGALPNGSDDVDMIVVQIGRRWYASPMLTAGHYIVENSDLPAGEYDRIGDDRDPGADSAAGAVEALVDVVNDPDADALAAALGGGEGRVAVAFRDAIDEGFSDLDTGDIRYDLSVETEDIGNGRVDLERIELTLEDEFSRRSATIENDCVTVREDGERTDRQCLGDALDFAGSDDLDTTIWLDTVDEDGGRRVRIVPTLTDVLSRFLTVFDDRQSLLFAIDSAQLDEANTVEPGSDIEIEFDGQLYSVNEFDIVAGEAYNVTASDDTEIDLFVDQGFGLEKRFSSDFVATDDGVARVVTYSDVDDEDCGAVGCLPSGRGEATLRIRQAGRQSVAFPQRITGEFGPGDVRVFELEIEAQQTVTIDVQGDFIGSELIDGFLYSVDDDTYDLPPGTYELVVYNRSGDDSTTYDVSPTDG